MHMLSLWQDMKKESGLRTIYIEISIILKFMERRPKTPGIIFKRYGMPQRKSTAWWWFLCCFGWKRCWYISKYKEMELGMDYLTSWILLAQMPVLEQSMCFSKADLSSLRHFLAKCKDKVLDVSCKFELKLTKLKDLFI